MIMIIINDYYLLNCFPVGISVCLILLPILQWTKGFCDRNKQIQRSSSFAATRRWLIRDMNIYVECSTTR